MPAGKGDHAFVPYYSARADEYERVYEKPERQEDLRVLHRVVPEYFAGRRTLDVACGTGYWTRRIATRAASVVGCDLADSVLALARARQPDAFPATFVIGDAFDLAGVPGAFDAACVGFWWSHIPLADLERFFLGLHQRLPAESKVLLIDNQYVAGSNYPITRADEAGNTYQRRTLEDGSEHEVLKNFPTPALIRDKVRRTGGREPAVHELRHYWYATYAVA